MSHSCTSATARDFLRRGSPRTRALYRRLVAMIGACGPYHVSPAKTRIAFMGLVRFAAVTAIDGNQMTVGFALPRPVRSRRFDKVEEIVPGWWGHWLRITTVGQLDRQLQGWLERSYRLMGMRERLASGRRP